MRLRPLALSLGLLLTLSLSVVSAVTVSQLETRIKQNPKDIKSRQDLGKYYLKKKKYEKAIEILAPYSNEIDDDSLQELADAYREQKDYKKEIRTLEIYLQRKPNLFRPHYLLGRALKDDGKFDEASALLRKSISLAPKHLPTFEALLDLFKTNKQNYESRILLTDMIRTFGERKGFLNDLCKLYLDDGFLAEARKTCQKAVKKDPRFPDNHVHLAQSFLDLENKQSAEKIFMTAARQFQKSEYVQWAVGEFYFQEKNYPTAVRYLKQAVKADAKSARSQLGLALSTFETKDYEAALPHYLTACKLDDSRVALEAFRVAASKLRQIQESESGKYELGLAKCGR